MDKNQQHSGYKGLILVSGIPASGKSSFALKLKNTLNSHSTCSKIFSTDNLEALITINP
jgi:tRNA uridine 5-carbamoylmethylation protein Kti12